MRSMRRLTALILAMMIVIPNTGNIMLGAATAKATTLRLEQTEGTATLKNANGIAKTIKAGMKLYNGDDVTTDKSSYAYISLDGTKAVKMDESSSVSIKQSGTQNEVMVNSGSLIFNVTVPLTKKESLNIRTSTMVTGVRGTIGYAKKISEEESEIAILEGKVELTSIDSKTGKSKSVLISAGEKGVCRRVKAKFEKNSDLQVPQVKAEKITEDDIPDFAVIEIGRNLDIQERLRKDGVFDVEKILARYRTLGDKGTYITIGTPVTPNSVSANKPVTPNTVSDNEAGGSGGGGGGGGGAGGGGGGGSAPSPAAAPSITLATINGGGVYAEGEPIGALSVTAEVDKAGAYTTYQWYVANSADGEGTAVNGATDTTYTPDSVLGTRYFYCVVRSKESSSSTAESLKETNRVVVAVKQPSTKVTEALSQPGDANIGFTSITLNPVSLASVGSIDGSINEAGSKIKLTGVSHSAQYSESLRAETVVFNAPVSNTSPVEGEVEYAKSTTTTAPTDDDEWQTDRTFNGLAMGTAYYFFARAAATGSTFAGAPSDPIEIWTKAGDAVSDYTDSTNHLYYTFDLRGYDGSVSPNAIVQGETGLTLDVGSITIPESIRVYDMDIKVTEILWGGFSDGQSCFLDFSSVVIPNTIEKIGNSAFYDCSLLTAVDIPDSVIEIEESAFNGCTSLETVHFGKNLKKIGTSAFFNCSKLNNVVLSDNVETIGAQAFYSCWGLSNITLNEGLKYIGESAFVNCPFTEITFPSTITAVSGNDGQTSGPFYAFSGSAGATAIYFAMSSAPDGWQDGWN
ncbi:MAG: leucine-rich repeat protein, partial [Lachnospiraceae bacterium]|nr:leucine-rich repeat protein [Lachnospiraceae bacterium]